MTAVAGIIGPPPQARATGAITGVVVDGSTNAPVEGAVVFLRLSGPTQVRQTRQITDDKGRFAFIDLPPGDNYTLSATCTGYAGSTYGRDYQSAVNAARPIAIAEGEWFAGARITMWPSPSVSGTVTDEAGEPVVGAYVRVVPLFSAGGHDHIAAGPIAITDDRGMYRIGNLTPGRYLVQVPSVQATAPASYTDAQLSGFTPQFEASERASGRAISIVPSLGVDPAARLVVGQYATPPPPVNGRLQAYPITFHPSATSLERATVLELKAGDERSNVDVRLMAVPTARIAGTVRGAPESFPMLILRLLPSGLEELGLGSEAAIATVAADGSFVFLGVPAGSYVIESTGAVAQYTMEPLGSPGSNSNQLPRPLGQSGGYSADSVKAAPPGMSFMVQSGRAFDAGTFGRLPVTVDARDQTGLVLSLRSTSTLRARVVFERDPNQQAAAPQTFPLYLEPANGDARLGRPQRKFAVADPVFEFVQPGEFFLRGTGYQGWIVKSILWDGREYADRPFDLAATPDISGVVITATNAAPILTGAVRDARGSAVDAAVIAFPVDPAGWSNYGFTPPRIEATTASTTGVFRMRPLPAGDYYIIAVPRAQVDAWMDPAFFKRAAPNATQVTLKWGATSTVDLKVQ
jgi:hypothetical protein